MLHAFASLGGYLVIFASYSLWTHLNWVLVVGPTLDTHCRHTGTLKFIVGWVRISGCVACGRLVRVGMGGGWRDGHMGGSHGGRVQGRESAC